MDLIRKLVLDRLPYYMISGLLSYHQIILKGQIRMDELIDYAWYNAMVHGPDKSSCRHCGPREKFKCNLVLSVIAPHQLCPDSRWGISPISPGTITPYPENGDNHQDRVGQPDWQSPPILRLLSFTVSVNHLPISNGNPFNCCLLLSPSQPLQLLENVLRQICFLLFFQGR